MNRFIAKNIATLTALYNSPDRRYHNLNHINHCLAELEYSKRLPEFVDFRKIEWEALETAIWFHDAIYNPRAQTITNGYNERESISLLVDLCYINNDTNELDAKMLQMAIDCIHVTAYYGKIRPNNLRTPVLNLMCDIDLSALGTSDYSTFTTNTNNVCAEYEEVGFKHGEVLKGNSDFLKQMLDMSNIFNTQTFKTTYEDFARRNITRRLEN